jgi:hypothetical protein
VKVYAPSTAHSGGGGEVVWHSTLAILSKLRRIASQTLHGAAHPGCDLPRRLSLAPCVPSRIVHERSVLHSLTNRTMRLAIAKKTICCGLVARVICYMWK